MKNKKNDRLFVYALLFLAVAFLLLAQIYLMNSVPKPAVPVTTEIVKDSAVHSPNPKTVRSSINLQLTACSDDDLHDAVMLIKPAIVNIDVLSKDVGNAPSSRGAVRFDVPSRQALTGNEETLGSGIIVGHRGYILTVYHIVKDYPAVYVTVFSTVRKSYKASVVATDPVQDLALLKIDVDFDLPVAKLGNSDMIKITDPVLTIGSPFSFEYTVTAGIISDNKRSITIDNRTYNEWFQTDAAINRGSAGGALISSDGAVIGINTAIVAGGDYFCGVSFAIPINKARPLLLQAMME